VNNIACPCLQDYCPFCKEAHQCDKTCSYPCRVSGEPIRWPAHMFVVRLDDANLLGQGVVTTAGSRMRPVAGSWPGT
jgi:hypothetical protein